MILHQTGASVSLWAAGLLFQAGILACHGRVVQAVDKKTADRLDNEPSRSTRMKASDDKVDSLERTVLRVGDADVSLTLDDAKAMRVALLNYLERSDYEDRDALIRWTQGPAWIDPEGKVRIGPWLLGSEGKDLVFRYREPPGQYAAKAHKAFLTKNDGTWTVSNLVMERIRVRR